MPGALHGTDLDILIRLHSYVDFLAAWRPHWPEPLHQFWRERQELMNEALRRFAARPDAIKLLLQSDRRLSHVIDSRCFIQNHALPPFDTLHVQEPLYSLMDDIRLQMGQSGRSMLDVLEPTDRNILFLIRDAKRAFTKISDIALAAGYQKRHDSRARSIVGRLKKLGFITKNADGEYVASKVMPMS
jgi:hypothetical protein